MYLKNLRIYGRHLRLDLADQPNRLPEAAQAPALASGSQRQRKEYDSRIDRHTVGFLRSVDRCGSGTGSAQGGCCHHWFATCDLIAMELGGLFPDGSPLWLGMGTEADWNELRSQHPHAKFAGLIPAPQTPLEN